MSAARATISAAMTLTPRRPRHWRVCRSAQMDDGKTSPRLSSGMRRAPVVQLTSSQRNRGRGVSADLIYCPEEPPVCQRRSTKAEISTDSSAALLQLSTNGPRSPPCARRGVPSRDARPFESTILLLMRAWSRARGRSSNADPNSAVGG